MEQIFLVQARRRPGDPGKKKAASSTPKCGQQRLGLGYTSFLSLAAAVCVCHPAEMLSESPPAALLRVAARVLQYCGLAGAMLMNTPHPTDR